ncbi:MAG: M48 family metalloprotease [Methylobacteriaceae bacterium]|nr:M48 family metalloprotease [Methylobacteriaceae bacterium]
MSGGGARLTRFGPAAAALLALAGCASLPETQPETTSPPIAAPRTTGVQTAELREHERLVALFGGEYRAPRAEALLNGVLARLAPASDTPGEPYKVTILNSPVVNAFALPTGNIYVTRGLLALANDTSEVAAVMAHEIAHVSARHAAARAELERRSQLVGRVVSEVLAKPQERNVVEARSKLTLASFSRQQELEADRIGVRNIARANYDPYGATRFLNSLGRSASLRSAALGAGPSGDRPDILATHPSTPDRVAAALAAARQIGAPGLGEAGRAPYLAVVDGVAYGDDPTEGIVRGRNFVHPKLAFAFEAPEGFTLENGPKALLGVAGGGAEALRLDSVRVSASTPLETYLGSGWIEGLQTATVETATINGLPAATAIARGQEWTFRLAAIRFGTDVYRLIFATRALTPDADGRFRAAIQSFRRISQDEAAAVKPLRLALTRAEPGAGAEALARRMQGVDRPLDLFLLLNGLERGAALAPGETYKIVVE